MKTPCRLPLMTALILNFGFWTLNLSSQPWMQPQYLTAANNKSLNTGALQVYNFYDIQAAFNAYWQGKTITPGCGYKPFRRWGDFWEPRVYPTGVFPPADKTNMEFQTYLNAIPAFKSAGGNNTLQSANWTSVGPYGTPSGTYQNGRGVGRVQSITFHPTNSNIMWAGTDGGGVWKTTDGGVTWSMLNTDNLPAVGSTAIAVDPSNTNILYVAVHRADGPTLGIWKTTDGGTTWNQTGLSYASSSGSHIWKIAINPSNSNILFAVTNNGGIWRSADGGTTWSKSLWYNPGDGLMYYGCWWTDIEFMPGNANVVYASRSGGCVGSAAVYKSTDGGINFNNLYYNFSSNVNRVSLAVTPADANVIYAFCCNTSGSFYGMYRSGDAGSTWSLQATSPNLLGYNADGTDNGGQGWGTLAIAVSPSDANTLFAGGVNMWKSADGGVNWTLKSFWATPPSGVANMHADFNALTYAPDGISLFCCNDGGVYKTTDGGTTWTELSGGLANTMFYRISDSEVDPSLVIGGAQDNSSFRVKNNVWNAILGTGDGMDNMIEFGNPDVMYASTQNGNVKRSMDGGATFTNITPSGQSGAWVAPYAMSYQNPQTIFWGGKEVYKSTNRGTAWTAISSNLTNGVDLKYMSVDNSGNTIYAATDNKLFKTSNGGTSWSEITSGLPVASAAISWVYTQPSNGNILWVTFSGYAAGQKVYYSTNGGASWTNFSGTLPDLPVNCILLDVNSTNQTLYLGADVGVYMRDNSMNDWTLFNTNLPNVPVRDLEINYTSGKLRAGTYGRGVWETAIQTTLNPPAALPCAAIVNFPNKSYNQWTGYQSGGYIFGTSTTNPNAESAEYYTPNNTYTHIMGVKFLFREGVTSNPLTSRITVKMWKNDGPNGKPGTVLAQKDVLIAQIGTDITNGVPTQVFFDNPVQATGSYYVGFAVYAVSGDVVGLFSTWYGDVPTNTGFVLFNNVWSSTVDWWGAGNELSMAAFPLTGNIPTPDFTANPTSGGTGTVVNFTNNSVKANGFIWTLAGATPASSYSMNPSATYNSTGSYNVKLKAFGSCNGVDSITKAGYINIGAPQVTANITNVSCNGSNNGAIDITVSGNNNYQWSNGATTQDITGLTAGNYTVTVTSGASNTTQTYTVTQPAGLSITSVNTNVSCNGGNNGTINITVSGGNTPYSYSWSNNKTTEDNSGVTAGTYTVTVTASGGCTATFSATITQPASLTATITSVTDATCGSSNGAIDLTPGGGTPAYSYSWSNGATVQDPSALGAGIYNVTVTDSKGCTKTANATVNQPSALSVAVTSVTNVSCNGGSNGSINITVSGGSTPYTYGWSNAATVEDPSGLVAGGYSVTVTDASGCAYNSSAAVTQPAALNVSATGIINVSCNGGANGSVNISVTGGTSPYGFNWSNSATTEDISGLAAANYSVTVSDSKSCTAVQSAAVSQPAVLSASLKTLTPVSCNGGTNGAVDINISGGKTPYTFNWSNNSTTEDVTALSAGTYTVSVSDNNSCQTTLNVVVTQPVILTAAVTTVTNVSCNGGSNGAIDLSVSGGNSPYSYNWNTGVTVQDPSGLSAAPYGVTVTDSKGCTTYASAVVNQPNALAVIVTSQINLTCKGGSNGSINITASGGNAPYSYSWSNGATSEDPSGLIAGLYTVTVSSTGGCTATTTATLTEPAILAAALNSKTNVSCNGGNNGSADITISGGTPPYAYNWSNGATVEDITGLNAGTYTVTVSGSGGNCNTAFSTTITQPAAISITVASTTPASCGAANGAIDISVTGGVSPYAYNWSNNATSQDISALTGGNYNVTVTDANNCKANKTAAVSQPGSPVSAIDSIKQVSCNGGSNGAVYMSTSGGTSPYTYNWSNSAATEDITGLISGSYSVTVTDATSCSITNTVSVNQPAPLSASVQGQVNASCNSGNNGSVDLGVTGGTPPYGYNWSNGATVQDPTGLGANTFNVTVTDNKGCTTTAAATITEPGAISTILTSKTNVSCKWGNNGSVNISVSGGFAPYVFNWSNGGTTEDISGLTANNYLVTVTDANGCKNTTSISVAEPALLTAAVANVTDANCNTNANGSIDLNVAGGTAPYTYQWSNGSTNQDIQNLSSGAYAVTVTDTLGCTANASATVNLPPSANLTLVNKKDVNCFGGSNGNIDINVTGGIPPYNYNWSNGATTQDVSGLAADTFTIVVTSGGGCSRTLNVIINEPPALAVSKTQVNVLCNGANTGAVTLAVSGGVTPYFYNWSNNATSKDILNLAAGTYTVTVKDANNCTVTNSSTLTEPAAILITSSEINTTCGSSTGSINITVSGGITPYTYNWSTSATTEDVSNLAAGAYTVTVKDGNNCTSSYSATITQPGTLTATTVKTDISCNGSGNGAVNLTPSGGTLPYTFTWNNGATTEDLTNLSNGVYSVTVADNANCSFNASATVSEPAVITAVISSVTNVSCYGGNNGTVNLAVSGGVAPYFYSWSNGATAEDPSGLTAGSYNVTIADNNGCNSVASATVNQPAQFTVSIISQVNVSCNGGNNGSFNLKVMGGNMPFSYNWSNGSSVEDPAGLTAGTYLVTVTDGGGCTANLTAAITQPSAIAINVLGIVNITCFGGNNGAIDIKAAGGIAPYGYAWTNGMTTEDVSMLAAGTYTVTVNDANGCAKTHTSVINQNNAIAITVTSQNNATCNGNANGSVNVTVTGGKTPYSFSWSNGATAEDIASLAANTYTLTVTDSLACAKTASATVTQPAAVTVSLANQLNVSCNGGGNGLLNVNATGGTSPYGFVWSNGQTTPSATGLTSGNYTVTATDANSCSGTFTGNISQPALLVASISGKTDNSACGANDGTIDVTVTGGTTAYTYLWSNGSAVQDISNLAAGIYSVTVKDANNCTDTSQASVAQPGSLTTSVNSVTNVSCNGNNDGAVDINVSGGTTPYTYAWSNSAATEDISGLAPATYDVTVTDAGNCVNNIFATVTEPAAITLTITIANTVSCNGGNNGALNLTVSGGTGPYNYTWSDGTAVEDPSGLRAGNYGITVTDASVCNAFASYTLTEPGPVSVTTISKADVTCNGGNNGAIDVNVSGGTIPLTFNWSNASITEDVINLVSGNYSLTVTDSKGCTAGNTTSITQPSVITGATSLTNVSANGGNDGAIDLTTGGGTSPYNFKWSNSATTEDISGLTAGTYAFTITDALNCSYTSSAIITQPASAGYCSGTTNLTAATDTFEDGSGNNVYATNADCKWLIQPSNTAYIILEFLGFRTQSNTDFVYVYDGASTSDSLLGAFSGSNLPYALMSSGNSLLVHFVTDGTVNDSGWAATYYAEPLPVTYCSGTTTLTATSGTFSDGSGASDYSSYSNCKWLLQPAGATSVTLKFTSFATELDYDYVTVYDGADTTANVLAYFTGSATDSVISSGGSMLVHFTSDYSMNAPGWDAEYTSSNTPNTFCSGTTTLTAASGSFGDGSGTANYGPNSDCRWLIQPPAASSITLTFPAFDIESGYDFVNVYDGATTSDSLIGSFTGNTLPSSITSSGGSMLVYFTSDYSVQMQGWFASYTSTLSAGAYCTGIQTVTASTGTICDGSSTNDYVENSDCKWLIQPAGATMITLNFTDFAVENGYDYVYVYEGADTSGALLAAYTGNNIPPPVTAVGGSMFVWFSSDYIVNDAGWCADYTSSTGTPTYCTGTVTLTAPSATFHDGSGPNNYLDNEDCYWLIQPPGAQYITLDFLSFATEAGYDSVRVFDGAATSDPLLMLWWGDTLPPQIVSSGGSLLVHFMSDFSNTDSGFVASYNAYIPPPIYCSGTTNLTAYSDTFSDGSGSNSYAENTNCKWLIQPPGAGNITLYFTSLDVENGYDYVLVYDGPDTLSPLLAAYTGNTIPSPVSSTGGSMFVQFMSDYVVNGQGWDAYYDTAYFTPVVYCSGTANLSAPSDTFSDGSGNNDYLINSDCKWLIQPAGATTIALTFTSFATEAGYDSVTVYDGATTTDPILGSFSGSALPPQLTSTGGVMLVHFTSDYLYNYAGWSASYTSTVGCAITASVAGTDATCNGCTDGAANLTVTGGVAPLTFSWSNSATSEDLAGIGAGIYDVTVTDANTCTATASVTITQPLQYCSGTTTLTANSGSFSDGSGLNNYADNSDCKWLIQPPSAATITLTFTAFDTETGYDSVTVYDGATTLDPVLGSYSGNTIPLPVTSTGGVMLVHFQSDVSFNYTGWDASYTSTIACAISASVTGTDATCNGCTDGAANLTVTGGVAPLTYGWSNSATTEDLTGIGAGTYGVTVTDANTCTVTASVTVTEPAAGPYCSGTVTLTAVTDTFEDGSGPSLDYELNSDCYWLIQPPGATSIFLNIITFDVENGYDWVVVYDGATTGDPVLDSLTGNVVPPMIQSSGGSMLVHFTSDYLINQAGWKAYYDILVDKVNVGGISQIAIYPNPTKGNITFRFSTGKPVEVLAELYNDIGQKIWTDEAKGVKGRYSRTMQLENFPQGLYTLQLIVDGVGYRFNVVKE